MNTKKQFKEKINELLVSTLKHYVSQHEAAMMTNEFMWWNMHKHATNEHMNTFSALEKILLEEKMLLPKTIKFIIQNKRDFEKDDKGRRKAFENIYIKEKKELKRSGTSSFFC